MVVSTYQAASGAGAAAMEELALQTREVFAFLFIYTFLELSRHHLSICHSYEDIFWKCIAFYTMCLLFQVALFSDLFVLIFFSRYWMAKSQHVKFSSNRSLSLSLTHSLIPISRFAVNMISDCLMLLIQYAFNVFSHNSSVISNGYNEEEMKLVKETRKIWVKIGWSFLLIFTWDKVSLVSLHLVV